MARRNKSLLGLATIITVLSSCGNMSYIRTPHTSDTKASLVGTWQLTSLEVDGQDRQLPQTELPLTIESEQISGNGGCNNFHGSLKSEDDQSLVIGDLISTEMACDHLDFESLYLSNLITADKWEAHPETIVIISDSFKATYTLNQ